MTTPTPTPDDFEQRAQRWLAGQATPDPGALAAVHGSIGALPARRAGQFGSRALAAAAVIALVVIASLALIARDQGIGGPPKPPDPAAFTGDPRLALCGPQVESPIAIFEMAHMSDYPRHFPNSYELRGLIADPDAPALVVISGDRQGGGRLPESSEPVETLAPGHHDLCIVVGADAASWAQIAVIDVDTTGYLAALPEGTAAPTPPDPAAFAGDPRLTECYASAGPVQYVFEMTHARDYKGYLPAMGLSPELDVDAPAFVVVFAAGAGPLTGGAPPPAATAPASPSPETGRSVCVLVDGTPNLYSGVDITGLTVSPSVISSPSPISEPAPSASAATAPTDAPAPAWTADLTGQLQCDGPPQSIGGETGEVGGETGSAISVEAAVEAFAATTFYTSMPARDYERAELEPHWARFEHRVDGRIKAILILADQGPDQDPGTWTVVGLRGCDPAEFAPDAGLTGALETIWLDRDEQRIPTTIIHEIDGPEHCGWESTIWLRVDGELFIRDPLGVLRDDTVRAYDGDATLPKAARTTGYHEGGRTIWRVATDRDSIYVVTTDRVERWPRAKDRDMGCA